MSLKRSSSQQNVKQMIIVLVVVLLVLTAVYFFTRIFVTKDLFNKKETTNAPVSINYDITTVGVMLSRPYDEYYVLAYYVAEGEALEPIIEQAVANYKKQAEANKIYYLELADYPNKAYYTNGKTNPESSTIANLKLGELTLLKIKNKKIVAAFETSNTILKELK